MNILSIIPARGGSKGLPGKNIKPLCKKPLIAYTIEAALKCPYISRTVVSTDSEEIAETARKYGADVPFLRPATLAADDTPSIDVVFHCLDYLKEKEMESYAPDYVCLLQCTSPLRNERHITEAVKAMKAKGAKSVVSVCEADKSPYWAKVVNENGYLEDLIKQETTATRRQDLPAVYNLNGAIYLNETATLYRSKALITENSYPYVMSRRDSIDIDDKIDLLLCEAVISTYIIMEA